MAPISWISLFFIFIISLFIFNMLNFYCFYNSPSFIYNNNNKKLFFKKNNFLNWMW